MPIQLPDLDNKTFDQLMEEMIASIPKYTREWTNFNPSDPGIAILELLAWMSESMIYKANRVSPDTYLNFLKLVSGDTVFDQSDQGHKDLLDYVAKIENDVKIGQWQPDVDAMKGQAAVFLQSRYRAVTEEDFRQLAKEALPDEIKRVEIFPGSYFIKVVIIPSSAPDAGKSADLCRVVNDYLTPRKLLGTVLKVQTAAYTPVSLRIEAVSYSYAKAETVKSDVTDALRSYLDPVTGGPAGTGWPYGRDVIVYELCNIVEKVSGVKMVRKIDPVGGAFPITIEGLVDHLNSSFDVVVKGEHEEKVT